MATNSANMAPAMGGSGYMFSSQPKPVKTRAKYRPEEKEPSIHDPAANLMVDRRVVRGNTYAPSKRTLPVTATFRHLPPSFQRKPQSNTNSSASSHKSHSNTISSTSSSSTPIQRVPTPEPVEGRIHCVVQTDAYLEDLRRSHHSKEISTQTIDADDRPSSPLFTPQSSGVDISTDIDIHNGDLFDFDLHVEALLNVIVSQCLEESIQEVCEEEEWKSMISQRSSYAQVRGTHMAELQRLALKDARQNQENQRRRAQEEQRIQNEAQLAAKRSALTLSKSIMNEVSTSLLTRMNESGHLYDPIHKQIIDTFIPWLYQQSSYKLQEVRACRECVDTVIMDAQVKGNAVTEKIADARRARDRERLARARYRHEPEPALSVISQVERSATEELLALRSLQTSIRSVSQSTDDDIEAEAESRLERIRSDVMDSLSYIDDIIRIQSLVRGNIARKRVRALIQERQRVRQRADLSPLDLLNSLRSFLGVSTSPIDGADGVIVQDVDTFGPFAQSSILIGDRILHIDDMAIDTHNAILSYLKQQLKVGDLVEVTVIRALDGREETIVVEVGTDESDMTQAEIRNLRNSCGLKAGVETWILDPQDAVDVLKKIKPKIGATIAETENKCGVKLLKVSQGGPAHRAGLVDEQLVYAVNGRRVYENRDFVAALKAFEAGSVVNLSIASVDGQASLLVDANLTVNEIDGSVKRVELGGAGKKNTVEWIRTLRRMAGLPVAGQEH